MKVMSQSTQTPHTNSGSNWDQFHQSTPKLLPPTVFEKTATIINEPNLSSTLNNTTLNATNSIHTPLQSNQYGLFAPTDGQINEKQMLLKLATEVEKLRFEVKKFESENETLRYKNKEFVEQAQLYSDASENRKISISALEEVIRKQTREIQSLKCELLNEKESNAAKQTTSEKKYNARLNELAENLDTAETKLKQASNERDRVSDEFQKYRTEKEAELTELKSRIEQIQTEKSSAIEENEARLKDANEENRKLAAELAQLRAYVNDSMPTVQTVKEMSEERQRCETEIVRLKVRNEQLAGENNALQIRLKSINEILSIQENHLEAKHPSISSPLINERRYHGLLNKWRTKVFELLVQLKSNAITTKLEKSELERERHELLDRLESETSRVRILENVIEDKKAEITVFLGDKTALNERVSELQERNAELQKQGGKALQSSLELKALVERLARDYVKIEESFKTANKRLSQLDQRLEFAKNRLGVLKALYASASAKRTHAEIEQRRSQPPQPPPNLNMTSILSSIHGSANLNEAQLWSFDNFNSERNKDENDDEKFKLLKNELEKVVNERDLLTSRLQNDTTELQTKLNRIRDENDLVTNTLHTQLKELREAYEQKEDEIARLKSELAEKTKSYDETAAKCTELERQLNEQKALAEHEAIQAIRQRESEFAEQLAQMDERLNEARREQAKAVVMVRQIERSGAREKERLEELLRSCDSYYIEHLGRLKDKVRVLEKERNALIVSLRQHGVNAYSTSNVAMNKSPLSFFEHDQSAKNWLVEKNNTVLIGAATSTLKYQSIAQNTEMTSFWVDESAVSASQESEAAPHETLQEIIEVDHDQNTLEEEQNENNEKAIEHNDDEGGTGTIMQQIRMIMGNLEISDDDEDDENRGGGDNNADEEEFETRRSNQDENVSRERQEQPSYFEVEHAIDEFIPHQKI